MYGYTAISSLHVWKRNTFCEYNLLVVVARNKTEFCSVLFQKCQL